jgi:hypothetical protein
VPEALPPGIALDVGRPEEKMTGTLQEILARTWRNLLEHTAGLLPKGIAGLLILALGILFARVARNLAARFFLAVRLDRLSDRLGISSFLARGDVRRTVVEILATIVYWLVLLFSLEILAVTLELHGTAAFLGQVIAYLPRVVVALVIAVVGIVVGSFFGGAVTLAGSNAGFPAARAAGNAVKYLIGFFALVMAFEQLQIATQLLGATLQIIIASAGLAVALAFGLGCREIAAETMRGWLAKDSRAHGIPGTDPAPRAPESREGRTADPATGIRDPGA